MNCSCDFVKFAPICGENNITYISACHAGCSEEFYENGMKFYSNCECIKKNSNLTLPSYKSSGGSAKAGSCFIDCLPKFYAFLFFLCLNKFMGGTEATANFLIGVRCVEKRDKAVSIGLATSILSLFAIIPSPIFFGWIIDRTCLFWGKTCSKKGNCWLYDTNIMRFHTRFRDEFYI